tara:strand:+ start:1116 stop:1304 length:189 start_codon:yes stop_codon:yes gene_type:complete
MTEGKELLVSLPMSLAIEIEEHLRRVNRSDCVTDGALSNDSLFLRAAIIKEIDKANKPITQR